MRHGDGTDPDPDIVLVILEMVRQAEPAFSPEKAREIEDQVRAQYGGIRTRIPKRKKHPTPELRAKVFQEALTTVSTESIVEGNGISRRTLYRYLKRGGS